MPKYTIEAESLEEIGADLHDLGVIGYDEGEWGHLLQTLERLLQGVAKAHDRSDGAGMTRSKVAEFASVEDEFDAEKIGTMLDVLAIFGFVDRDERRYRLDARGEELLR